MYYKKKHQRKVGAFFVIANLFGPFYIGQTNFFILSKIYSFIFTYVRVIYNL